MPHDIQDVPLSEIVCRKQVRQEFDEDSLKELAQSISVNGVLVPVILQRLAPREHLMIDGERRFRASGLAGKSHLPAIVRDGAIPPAELLVLQTTANLHRADLRPMEKARAIAQLMESGKMTAVEVATRLALSGPTVSRLLKLLTLPEEMQKEVDTGRIPMSAACELAQIADPVAQAAAADRVIRGDATRDVLVGARRAAKRSADEPGVASKRVTAVLENGRSVTVAGDDLNLETFILTLEECLAQARKHRPSGIALPTFVRMLRDKACAST